jgi:hypothetical protein
VTAVALLFRPPATSTSPFFSRVAVWSSRGVVMLPVGEGAPSGDPAGDEHLAVGKQGRGRAEPVGGQVPGKRPFACCRVVQLGAADRCCRAWIWRPQRRRMMSRCQRRIVSG